MKAIPFVCFCLFLVSAFVLTEVRRDNHMVFDDDPFGCDYFSCDDIEALLGFGHGSTSDDTADAAFASECADDEREKQRPSGRIKFK